MKKMKLFKMIPLVALTFAVTANSAFADVGKVKSAEDAVGKMCAKIAAYLVKDARKLSSPVVKGEAKPVDDKALPVDATAM